MITRGQLIDRMIKVLCVSAVLGLIMLTVLFDPFVVMLYVGIVGVVVSILLIFMLMTRL